MAILITDARARKVQGDWVQDDWGPSAEFAWNFHLRSFPLLVQSLLQEPFEFSHGERKRIANGAEIESIFVLPNEMESEWKKEVETETITTKKSLGSEKRGI